MEIRRYLSTRMWGESWFEPLTAPEKLTWIYLLTNPYTNMLGIYDLTPRRIGYDCNINEQAVRRHIKKFEELGLIIMKHGYIIINRWINQNAMNPSMKISALKDFDKLPEEVRATLPVEVMRNIENMRAATRHPVSILPSKPPIQTLEKEEKEEKKHKKESGTENVNENSLLPLAEVSIQATANLPWMEALCMNNHQTMEELNLWVERFCRKLQNEGNESKSVRDFRKHFSNWLSIQLNNTHKPANNHENPATTNRKASQQRKLDTITALHTTVCNDARQQIEQLRASGVLPEIPET